MATTIVLRLINTAPVAGPNRRLRYIKHLPQRYRDDIITRGPG
jgi:hypothetical protein